MHISVTIPAIRQRILSRNEVTKKYFLKVSQDVKTIPYLCKCWLPSVLQSLPFFFKFPFAAAKDSSRKLFHSTEWRLSHYLGAILVTLSEPLSHDLHSFSFKRRIILFSPGSSMKMHTCLVVNQATLIIKSFCFFQTVKISEQKKYFYIW